MSVKATSIKLSTQFGAKNKVEPTETKWSKNVSKCDIALLQLTCKMLYTNSAK